MYNKRQPKPSRGARTGGGDLGGDRHLEPGVGEGPQLQSRVAQGEPRRLACHGFAVVEQSEDGFERLLHQSRWFMGSMPS